jgi:hypothetical protein
MVPISLSYTTPPVSQLGGGRQHTPHVVTGVRSRGSRSRLRARPRARASSSGERLRLLCHTWMESTTSQQRALRINNTLIDGRGNRWRQKSHLWRAGLWLRAGALSGVSRVITTCAPNAPRAHEKLSRTDRL